MNKLSYRRKSRLIEKLAGAARVYRLAKAQAKRGPGAFFSPSEMSTPLGEATARAGFKHNRRMERYGPESYMARAGTPTKMPKNISNADPAQQQAWLLGQMRRWGRGGGQGK